MRNLFSILLISMLMLTVFFMTGCCSASDLNTISNETIKISNMHDIYIKPIENKPVDELDVDEAINNQFVNDYDEEDNILASSNEKKFDDNWVTSQNIPDVKTTDDYKKYLKEQLKIEQESFYNDNLDKIVWNELKTHCQWVKKPEMEINDIYQKYINNLEDDEIDEETKSVCLEDAEDETMHKEAISLLAKKFGIHVIQTDIDIKKEELMKELDCSEEELRAMYSSEELEYEAYKDWVNHCLYDQLKNNSQK